MFARATFEHAGSANSALSTMARLSGEGHLAVGVGISTAGVVTPRLRPQLAFPGVDVSHGVYVLFGYLTDDPDSACLIRCET